MGNRHLVSTALALSAVSLAKMADNNIEDAVSDSMSDSNTLSIVVNKLLSMKKGSTLGDTFSVQHKILDWRKSTTGILITYYR